MPELQLYQYALIGLVFIWSGFVRSGLGFGGAVLSLPFMLLIVDQPLFFLPIISLQLMFFSSITLYLNHRSSNKPQDRFTSAGVNWRYLRFSLAVTIVPKLIGVFGLITLPGNIMSAIIFVIVSVYSLSYIFNKPFKSRSKTVDIIFLMLGGYISGTSLIGAPLVIAVFASHVAKNQMRDTLFALWFILVGIKVGAFLWAGVDLQLKQQLWLLPCGAIGHLIGLRVHNYLLHADSKLFYRVLGSVLLLVSLMGMWRLFSPTVLS